jgi:hypothetical protein
MKAGPMFFSQWLDRSKKMDKTDLRSPVFIYAASWRTGSTLLQRIVNASKDIFVWGEPAFLPEVRNLYERAESYLNKVTWSRKTAFHSDAGKWAAVISPPPERLKTATRAFFEELYQEETENFGMKRWGFKEVRSNAVANMCLLKNLYPDCKFLFLVRDPYDTYRSMKGKKFHANFREPMEPVIVWRDNVTEFLEDTAIGKNALLIRYEDLTSITKDNNALLHKITDHIRTKLTDKMYRQMEIRIDSSGIRSDLTCDEVRTISNIAGKAAKRLGYTIR